MDGHAASLAVAAALGFESKSLGRFWRATKQTSCGRTRRSFASPSHSSTSRVGRTSALEEPDRPPSSSVIDRHDEGPSLWRPARGGGGACQRPGGSVQPYVANIVAALTLPLTCLTYSDCYELPVVIVSAVDRTFPDATCNQLRYPAEDCLKAIVHTRVEVIDNQSVDTASQFSTGGQALNCFDPTGNLTSSAPTSVYSASSNYRGQTSLFFPKHQLNVKFPEPTSFLGMPEDTAFVLNGPYLDCSMLRNHLAHWLFRSTGRYSPHTRHVVVYFKPSTDPDAPAQYLGVYLLLEKLSYGKNRVNLAKLGSGEGADMSGGWAWQNDPLSFGSYSPNVVLDQYQNEFGMGERPILAHPSGSSLSQRQRDYFVNTTTGFLPQFYRALWNNLSSEAVLEQHADLGSFADYLLHTEMSLNVDAYRRSTFYFKDQGQPINAGPVWDLNLAYGNGARRHFRDWIYPQYTYWKRLMCNHKLASLVIQRWKMLRGDFESDSPAAGTWSDESIGKFLDASAAPMARQLEKCRNQLADWRGDVRQCASVNLIECNGTYSEQVESLKVAVTDRARWMDEHITELYKSLDASTCSGVGDVPKYNCAADGNDDGCLSDPESYYSRVTFPPVRQPVVRSEAEPVEAVVAAVNEMVDEYDKSSEDNCWKSAGLYVYPEQKGVREKSLTFFCNGYGSCPQGPGAACTCAQGVLVEEKTCRRIDAEMVVKTKNVELPVVDEAKHYTAGPIVGSLAGVLLVGVAAVGVGMLVVRQREKRRRLEQLNVFRPVRYGSMQDYNAFMSSSPLSDI